MTQEDNMLIIGHRGCNYPYVNQNTIRAYRTVVEQGATAFEFDVQLTADHQLVVVHNLDLSKVSDGSGLVRRHSLSYIRKLHAGKAEKGLDQIPLLSEVLDMAAGYQEAERPVLHLELKGDGTGLPTGDMIKSYLDAGKLRMDDILISSFNWHELQQIRTVLPTIRIALLDGSLRRKKLLKQLPGHEQLFSRIFNYGEEDYMIPWSTDMQVNGQLYRKEIADDATLAVVMQAVEHVVHGDCYNQALLDTAVSMGATSVNLWYDTLVLRPEFVQQAHDRNLLVYVYTVNTPQGMLRLKQMGVDGLFTDDYLLAVDTLQ